MKRTHFLPLAVFFAASAMAVGARAESTADTPNVTIDYGSLEIIPITPDIPSAGLVTGTGELPGTLPGHVALIPETGTTGLLLAAGALGAAAWLRRRVR